MGEDIKKYVATVQILFNFQRTIQLHSTIYNFSPEFYPHFSHEFLGECYELKTSPAPSGVDYCRHYLQRDKGLWYWPSVDHLILPCRIQTVSMFCIKHKNAESQPEQNKALINSLFLAEDGFASVGRNLIIHKRLIGKLSLPSDNGLLTTLLFLFQFSHWNMTSSPLLLKVKKKGGVSCNWKWVSGWNENESQNLFILSAKTMIACGMSDIVIGIEGSKDVYISP